MRASLLAASLVLVACGSPSNNNDGGTDAGGNPQCDGAALTPPNLIHNNSFECGGANPAEWGAVFGTLDFPSGTAHTGVRNARVTAGSNGDARLAYNLDVIDNAGMATVCLSAWVKGTTPYMRVRLLTSGGSTMAYEFSSPAGATWQQIPPAMPRLAAKNLDAMKMQLVFESQVGRSDGMNSVAGDTLEVDDVDAWISPDGHCRER